MDELLDKLAYSGENVNRTVRIHSDEYSRLYCDKEKAIRYAISLCNGSCLYCSKKLYQSLNDEMSPSSELHLDHIYPASYGGLFTEGNVALSCSSCNTSKGAKSPIDYYRYKLANDEICRFADVKTFQEFVQMYTKPYRQNYARHFEFTQKALSRGEISLTELISLFAPNDKVIIGQRAKGLKRDKYKFIDKAIPFPNVKLIEKRIMLHMYLKHKELGLNEIEFNIKEMKKELNLQKSSDERIISLIKSLLENIDSETYENFSTINLSDDTKYVTVKLSNEFITLSERVGFDNFTKTEQHIYNKAKSSYTQDLYSIVNKYDDYNVIKLNIDTFRETFNVPQSFTLSNIDNRIIDKTCTELSTYFNSFTISKEYGDNNRVTAIKINVD